MRLYEYCILCILSALFACNNKDKQDTVNFPQENLYAENIIVTQHDDYTRIDIKNPWEKNSLLQTYILVPRSSGLPDSLPEGTVIQTPLRSVLVYSSVHAQAIKELGHIENITGVCDAQYFSIKEINAGVSDGSIVNAGTSMSPIIEKIIALAPEAIILSPYQNSSYGDLTRLGIPIIECADYMETSPLGRAEWIKLFGCLFQEQEKADSIFGKVKNDYNTLREIAKQITVKPKILSENIINGTWYVPGGDSYMAKLFADAGGTYAWSNVKTSGSIPLDMPRVLEKAHDADIWLIKSYDSAFSYSKLKSQNALNAQFKAFKEKNIYFCNTTSTTLFQDFPFHPEVLLKEYMAIFHPKLITDYNTKYFKPLRND